MTTLATTEVAKPRRPRWAKHIVQWSLGDAPSHTFETTNGDFVVEIFVKLLKVTTRLVSKADGKRVPFTMTVRTVRATEAESEEMDRLAEIMHWEKEPEEGEQG